MKIIHYQDPDYYPQENLPSDLMKMLISGYGEIGIIHTLYRGKGLPVVDLVESMLEVANTDYWLPDEFFTEMRLAQDVDSFKETYCRWATKFAALNS